MRTELHEVRIQDQCVVLVGGYKDMDTARKALDGFKKLKPTVKKVMPVFITQQEGIENGKAKTDYLQIGDRVRIEALGSDGASLFGAINQLVEPFHG